VGDQLVNRVSDLYHCGGGLAVDRKALGDALKPYFTGEVTPPAKLRIFVSGCPALCAGGSAMDIVIVGQWGAPPKIRE
jgi:sulfite reductase beta subunit